MIAILTYAEVSNPRGLPTAWPAETQQCATPPDARPWQMMTEVEYAAYVAAHQAEYDAWVAQQAAILDPARVYADKLAEGYLDPVTGIKLKTTIEAQRLFTSMVALVREGLDLGQLTNDSMQTIWDADEQPHELTVLQLRGLMLRYGVFCQQLFAEFAP